jgi:uncharacterized Fe-S radical SAM superfamily protein PflX
MASETENMAAYTKFILNSLNLLFTTVFIIEAILKIIAYAPRIYFSSSWNKFDLFVVCASIVDIFLEYSGNSIGRILTYGPQIAKVFRLLRVTRLFRIIK